MDEGKLVAMSRRLYKQSVDVSSITPNLVRQGRAIKRNAEDCDYSAIMWEYRILLREAGHLRDIVHDAYLAKKISASDVDKTDMTLTDFQREAFEDMEKALREKCRCK